jgi:nitroimidazol reductase NimA-like FMN-containing flavoprotein (pyridoxamine 5'-phosphate oxidase superfamily)
MRRSDRHVTDTAELESIIHSGELCFLSMVDEGRPYLVPMNFGYGNGTLYFHSAPEGRKIEILTKNPDVCFSIVARHSLVRSEKACSWSTEYSSVTGTGRAAVLSDPEEIRRGLKVLMGQYSNGEYDFDEMQLRDVVVIKVEIEEVEGKKSTW